MLRSVRVENFLLKANLNYFNNMSDYINDETLSQFYDIIMKSADENDENNHTLSQLYQFNDWNLFNTVDDASLSQLGEMYDISTKSGIYIFNL